MKFSRISLTLLLLPLSSYAQQAPENAGRDWTSIEIVLSVAILVFALLVLGFEAWIVQKAQKPWAPQSIVRAFGITLILSFAVILVVAGYSKDQVGPVMGLLGVVAGYLLGNSERSGAKSE